jgi:hypothetical protein
MEDDISEKILSPQKTTVEHGMLIPKASVPVATTTRKNPARNSLSTLCK